MIRLISTKRRFLWILFDSHCKTLTKKTNTITWKGENFYVVCHPVCMHFSSFCASYRCRKFILILGLYHQWTIWYSHVVWPGRNWEGAQSQCREVICWLIWIGTIIIIRPCSVCKYPGTPRLWMAEPNGQIHSLLEQWWENLRKLSHRT